MTVTLLAPRHNQQEWKNVRDLTFSRQPGGTVVNFKSALGEPITLLPGTCPVVILGDREPAAAPEKQEEIA